MRPPSVSSSRSITFTSAGYTATVPATAPRPLSVVVLFSDVRHACSACRWYPQYASAESAIPALVLGLTGAQGYCIANGDSEFGVPTMPYPRNNVTTDAVANIAGITACASDTFNPVTLTFDLASSDNAQCWPWTSQVVAMVRTAYTTTATDTSSCSRGIDALRWLQWLYTNSEIDTLTSSVDVQLASSLSPAVQAAYLAALDSVTCNGETLLITLPTVWTLSTGIAAFTQALSAIGLAGCTVAAVLVWYHHAHPVIRSASPLFLLLSILGVALLFGSAFVLVVSASAVSCSAFSWLLNVGLQLCFAPLFAKTYRIYRIFGRRKLSVVQLSNRRLLVLVALMLAVEAVLMAAWQAVAPLAPLVVQQTSSTQRNEAGNAIVSQYVQCGVPAGQSMSLFAVVCVEKGLLFVFGALMAFSTRKVNSTFNESQGISLSIYNVCFTIGIIAPIIVVVSAMGDVLTLLQVFALLWIAYFTGSILVVPKLMTIYTRSNGADPTNNSVATSSSSSGYQFLSLAVLSTLPLLQNYQAALRKHLEAVDSRISRMKADKSSGSATLQPRSSGHTPAHTHNVPATPPIASRRRVSTGVEHSILDDKDDLRKPAVTAASSRNIATAPMRSRPNANSLIPAQSMTSSIGDGKQVVEERSTHDDEQCNEEDSVEGDRAMLGEQLLLNRTNTGS